MKALWNKSNQLVGEISLGFTRHIIHHIDWNHKLIGIIGPRGVGKTTLLLQQLKRRYGVSNEALYISLDDLCFSNNSLYQIAFDFRNRGGKCLFVDEVHKYTQWSIDMRNIFHNLSDLKIVFAGSSIIDLLKQDSDFCRNAITYSLSGLSFREYLERTNISEVSTVDFETLLKDHKEIATGLSANFKPLLHFENYLKSGYYPCVDEQGTINRLILEQYIKQTIETDLNYMDGYDPRNVNRIKQLLHIIAQGVPLKPNIVKLSERIGIHRNTLVVYLFHLEKARLIQLLYPSGSIISILQKPHYVFLNNANIAYIITEKEPEINSLRKTFFMNQVGAVYSVKSPRYGDFEVDGRWIFDVGEHKKLTKHLKDNPNAYLATDGIEIGSGHTIPLWMFGLLY
jgi:hypothetical protein